MDSSVNEFNVDRADDGRLLAAGWHGYSCGNCGSFHIDLLDKDNKAFASMVIEDDHLMELTQTLIVMVLNNLKENVAQERDHDGVH